jgi:hypothetical protein
VQGIGAGGHARTNAGHGVVDVMHKEEGRAGRPPRIDRDGAAQARRRA